MVHSLNGLVSLRSALSTAHRSRTSWTAAFSMDEARRVALL
jgi:hypothetical protein